MRDKIAERFDADFLLHLPIEARPTAEGKRRPDQRKPRVGGRGASCVGGKMTLSLYCPGSGASAASPNHYADRDQRQGGNPRMGGPETLV